RRLALYVYEYLLHVGAQKSAQTFLSEIRWEKNITLGEPPGFLHSWWCGINFFHLAARLPPAQPQPGLHGAPAGTGTVVPPRVPALSSPFPSLRFPQSAAAAPSPVMGNMPPSDGLPGAPMPPGFFQGPPGSQPSPHAQPPPHNPSAPLMGPHSQ
ncbi:single-stranded DNA-binding protein 4, partial [Apteryx rowi]|uniref:single-stranded DNA-binding protein 4 n=1 Tax=Apteryx rowi TaxID=308060 RepID=UPI000E1CEF13